MPTIQSAIRVSQAALALLISTVQSACGGQPPASVSFRNDVMAVLSKSGCNSGPCHGNQNGKAGFKLSLRGEDPAWDFRALTRDAFARRINPTETDQSLILLKATTQLAHEGGLRFRKDSVEYQLLRDWIAADAADDAASAPKVIQLEAMPTERIIVAPETNVSLRVAAQFSDGKTRDVTRLAVYDPSSTSISVSHDGLVSASTPGECVVVVRYLGAQTPVRLAFVPERPGFVPRNDSAHNFIDSHIFTKLQALRMNPSGLCTDGEFIRRASLDLLGVLPSAAEARAFAGETSKGKREHLIDELMMRPEFADFWALKWSDVLRNEEKVLDRKGIQLYHDWIRQ